VTALPDDLLSAWNEPALEAIVRAGSLDARTAQGATGLWHAVYFGRPAWALRLLAAGASPGAHDVAAIDRALRATVEAAPNDTSSAPDERRADRREAVLALLDAGADAAGALPSTGWHSDAWYATTLLARGADADARDEHGRTALHLAASRGSVEVARALLARGADPRLRAPTGESPYEIARRAWRVDRVDDARLVMQCLDAVGAGAAPDPPPLTPPRTGFEEGSTVRHGKFGEGVVRAASGAGDEMKLTIDFVSVGQKTLLARFVTAG